MKVVVHSGSGDDPGTLRLHGLIESAERTRNIWFDLPDDADTGPAPSGNSWLSLLLPYAMQTGERVDLELPVDPLLLENARQLAVTWHSWYPELKPPEIHARTRRAKATAGRIAQFFSGGVDSWFTLLRHTESTPRFPQVGEVDDLITVWGFDIPIGRADEFQQLSKARARSQSGSASATSSRPRICATNGGCVEGCMGAPLGIAFTRRCACVCGVVP